MAPFTEFPPRAPPYVTVSAAGELPKEHASYVVVGHCCESGDLMTPTPDDAAARLEAAAAETSAAFVAA